MKPALVTSILALLASASLVLAQSTATAKPTTAPPAAAQALADRNRAVAVRVFEEIFNQRRPEVAAEIYSPNFRNHGIHSDASLEVDQGWARGELRSFPDLHMAVVKPLPRTTSSPSSGSSTAPTPGTGMATFPLRAPTWSSVASLFFALSTAAS
jgi:hypothetical protein